VRRLVRLPIVHFVLAGAALALASRAHDAARRPPAAEPIVAAAQVQALREGFARDHGRPPTDAEAAALVARAVDEELLYREALARGLDRGDRSIRWRLAETMDFLDGGAAAGGAPPAVQAARAAEAAALGLDRGDPVVRRMLVAKMRLVAAQAAERDADDAGALHACWQRHRARWTRPATVTFRHVFFSRAERGARLAADAERALRALRAGRAAGDGGDAFFGPPLVEARSEAQIAATFGAGFARGVAQAPAGDWTGPLRSPWGLHLVRVERREPETVAPFEAVRTAVRLALLAERREARVQELLAALRARWGVRGEPPKAPS